MFEKPPFDRSAGQSLLQVRNLQVHYSGESGQIALRDVSFDLAAGEAVGLLGESGCGKTTLALALARLLPPSARVVQGSIRFLGREVRALDERALQELRGGELALVFQEPALSLNPVMRAGEQIAEVIAAHRPWSRQRCRQEAEALLRQVGLGDAPRIFAAYPHQLSGGQQQRVAIAQALACGPRLVIADEPTAALDSIVQAEILALLLELKERLALALLFITHNPALLVGLADRVMVMYAGRIVEEGPWPRILRAARHPYTQRLLSAVPPLPERYADLRQTRLPFVAGTPADLERLTPECTFEPRCPDMPACVDREPGTVKLEAGAGVRCFKYGG